MAHPLTSLILVIAATMIGIFVMAILMNGGSKKKGVEEAPKPAPEPMNPFMEKPEGPTGGTDRKVCVSQECITLSYQLLNWRDVNTNPCDDFYQFTCGKYNRNSGVRGSQQTEKEAKSIKLIIENLRNSSSTQMKMFYDKCESLKSAENFQKELDQSYLEIYKDMEKIGSFPMSDKNWDETQPNLNDYLKNMAKLGVLDFGLFKTSRKNENLEISTNQDEEWLENPDFKETLQNIFHANKIEFNTSDMENDLKNVQEFAKALPKDSEILQENNFTTLKSQIPSIDFDGIIKSLIPSKDKPEVTANGDINKVENLLKSTSPRILANFLVLKFISGSTVIQSLDCGKTTIDAFPRAAAQIFSKAHPPPKNHLDTVTKIVEDTRKSNIKMINETTWLQIETKKNAIEKLKDMKTEMRYSEDSEDSEKLQLSLEDSWYTLNKKLRNLEPKYSIFEPNAFYKKSENSFLVLMPIIEDDPIFDKELPKYAKIARKTGKVIAREMEKVLEDVWNSDSGDVEEWKKRKSCLKENPSELLGLEASWLNYKNLKISEEPVIPGFQEYDNDKLFFQLLALDYCNSDARRSHVNGIFSNMKSFSKTFNCLIGAPMGNATCQIL